MALSLYNVRTRQKEPFTPLDPEGKVGMYVCGLTVYDHVHLGHARTAVSFEVIRRWLERSYELTYVQNVTDVDDKIIKRATELGVSPKEHAETWDKKAVQAMTRLGVREPDIAPHATTSMDGIVAFIQRIIDAGFAYSTETGNVYFDVPGYDANAADAFPEQAYGSLSRRDFREMAAGTRKDVESDKQHPADFALWKAAKPDEGADARWASPWSEGRPGWHIECSHMSTHSLGTDQIDIHGGGQDLIFPHHENEIAQAQAATGCAPFVNVWMHTGFLNVEGTKMSKSLGNFIVLEELMDELAAEGIDLAALRFYFAQTHYRSKIDFSRKGLTEASTAVERLERTRRRLHEAVGDSANASSNATLLGAVKEASTSFDDAMNDDIHTPGAIAAIWELVRAVNGVLDAGISVGDAQIALEELERMGQTLTLFDQPMTTSDGPSDELKAMLAEREVARAAKDWAKADEIRDTLTAAGWFIQDSPTGPRLERS